MNVFPGKNCCLTWSEYLWRKFRNFYCGCSELFVARCKENKFLTFTNVSEIGRSLPNTLFAYIPAVLYSRSSRKWPPRKFEKVVLTRAVRLQDWALVSDKSFRNSLKNHKEMTLNFFKYLYNTALCKIFVNESLTQCAVSSKCWFVCVRLWMVAYKSLKTKEKASWVIPN